MSSASRATNRSEQIPARQHGRLARLIYYTYLPICLVPMLLLGGLVFWVVRLFLYQITSPAQAAIVSTQFGLVVLVAVFLTAALTLIVSLRAARRLTHPLPALVDSLQKFLAGNLDQRLLLTRKNAAHGELADLVEMFNRLGDDYRSIYNSLSRRDSLQKDASQTHEGSIIQVAQAAVKANSLDELLQSALQIIAQDFACLYGAAYLLESQPGKPQVPTLLQSVRTPDFTGSPPGPTKSDLPQSGAEPGVPAETNPDYVPDQDWLGEQASTAQRAMVDSYSDKGSAQPSGSGGSTPGYLEAAIPILWGGQTLGVLDLVSSRSASDANGQPFSPFASRSLSELQKIADVIALAMAALAPRASTTEEAGAFGLSRSEPVATILPAIGQTPAGQLGMLYQSSHTIARAQTSAEVFQALAGALDNSPYPAAVLMKQTDGASPSSEELKFVYRSIPETTDALNAEGLSHYFASGSPVLLADLVNLLASSGPRMPQALMDFLVNDFARQSGCTSAGLVPVLRNGQLVALLALGRRGESNDPTSDIQIPAPPLTTGLLVSYSSLIELAVTELEQVASAFNTQHKLAELQIISNISQTISLESNLGPLYQTIYQQLESVMGKFSSFAIALFDAPSGMIQIPYIVEEGIMLDIPPFPMGKGLTSIVLRNRKPLLLVENVEAQTKALGAVEVGPPAMSWLGVPMLYAGEIIGAIIVQDIRQEHRFSESDQDLLTTLAAQVAVVVRNARLLESTQRRASQERYLNEIIGRIRRAPDIQSILKTTADELGAALAVQQARIRIGASAPGETAPQTTQPEAER